MDIIEKVIYLCEDAEVLKSDNSKTVLVQVKPRGRVHAVFGEDREMFIAFTDNQRNLFGNNSYLGAVMIDRIGNGYAVRHFYVKANVVELNGGNDGERIRTIEDGMGRTDLIWNIGNHDMIPRDVFECNYRGVYSPEAFEKNWARTSQHKFAIRANDCGDGFAF
ncbi:hypothetical protein IJM16_02220 [Candidatus Saccharibacteria bacterium]|nr:hypothetical protein [Candidatus Saccharibacteria bacterium]